MDYNVVFEYTGKLGSAKGIRTWSTFVNKDEFDKWYNPTIKETNIVVAEGITGQEAIELCKQTPLKCYFDAAVQEVQKALDSYRSIEGVDLEGVLDY